MEEATFMRELNKYRVVRSRDWTATGVGVKRRPADAAAAATTATTGGASRAAALPSASAAAVPATTRASVAAAAATAATTSPPAALSADEPAPPALPEATLRYADFWEGLDALLAVHFPDARMRKAVAGAFDEVHYEGLRSGTNLEDVDDVAAMMARELAEEGR